MLSRLLGTLVATLGLIGPAMAQQRVLISSDWGRVTAELVDNDATRASGPDAAAHDRDARPPAPREDRLPAFQPARRGAPTRVRTGTLGLWNSNHFVIYYAAAASLSLGSSPSAA
jgi:hypothetical protein